MSNVQRVLLSEDVEDVIEQAGQNDAYRILEAASKIGEREQRPMSLAEALAVIRQEAQKVEALG